MSCLASSFLINPILSLDQQNIAQYHYHFCQFGSLQTAHYWLMKFSRWSCICFSSLIGSSNVAKQNPHWHQHNHIVSQSIESQLRTTMTDSTSLEEHAPSTLLASPPSWKLLGLKLPLATASTFRPTWKCWLGWPVPPGCPLTEDLGFAVSCVAKICIRSWSVPQIEIVQ